MTMEVNDWALKAFNTDDVTKGVLFNFQVINVNLIWREFDSTTSWMARHVLKKWKRMSVIFIL